jgi:hypothetical protein
VTDLFSKYSIALGLQLNHIPSEERLDDLSRRRRRQEIADAAVVMNPACRKANDLVIRHEQHATRLARSARAPAAQHGGPGCQSLSF